MKPLISKLLLASLCMMLILPAGPLHAAPKIEFLCNLEDQYVTGESITAVLAGEDADFVSSCEFAARIEPDGMEIAPSFVSDGIISFDIPAFEKSGKRTLTFSAYQKKNDPRADVFSGLRDRINKKIEDLNRQLSSKKNKSGAIKKLIQLWTEVLACLDSRLQELNKKTVAAKLVKELEIADFEVQDISKKGLIKKSGIIQQDETWLCGKTYLVESDVIISGCSLTIQPGAIILFSRDSSLIIGNGGKLLAKGEKFLPIVFTKAETEKKRTEEGYYKTAINVSSDSADGTIVENVKVYSAKTGISLQRPVSGIRNCVIKFCEKGIELSGMAEEVSLVNNLITDCSTAGISLNNIVSLKIQNHTFDRCKKGISSSSADSTVTNIDIKDSIFSDCTSAIDAPADSTITSDYNAFYRTGTGLLSIGEHSKVLDHSPFEKCDAGNYFLKKSLSLADAGSSSTEEAGLSCLTTSAPANFLKGIVSKDTTIPLVLRDMGTVDIGYHYAPIDAVIMKNVSVLKAKLTLQPGTAIALSSDAEGIMVQKDGSIKAQGTPKDRIIFTSLASGGDDLNFSCEITGKKALTLLPGSSESDISYCRFQFSKTALKSVLAQNAGITHCQFLCNGTGLDMLVPKGKTENIFNNLFAGNTDCGLDLECAAKNSNLYIEDNTFDNNGTGAEIKAKGADVSLKDNIFSRSTEKPWEAKADSNRLISQYNAYYENVSSAVKVSAKDIILNDDPFEGCGIDAWLLKQSSPCVDNGSALSSDKGLDVFCTSSDGAMDSGKVDIGYHYPDIFAPNITIISPEDKQTVYLSPLTLEGQVDDLNAKVYVNDKECALQADGRFSSELSLSAGENIIKVEAKDLSDNICTILLHVSYVPDTDGDGLSYDEEIKNGTDPYNSDSDGDSLNDGQEVKVNKTNPLAWDSDGDGFSDGEEVAACLNPLDPYSRNAPLHSVSLQPGQAFVTWLPVKDADGNAPAGYKVYAGRNTSGMPYTGLLDKGVTVFDLPVAGLANADAPCLTMDNLPAGSVVYVTISSYDKNGDETIIMDEVKCIVKK